MEKIDGQVRIYSDTYVKEYLFKSDDGHALQVNIDDKGGVLIKEKFGDAYSCQLFLQPRYVDCLKKIFESKNSFDFSLIKASLNAILDVSIPGEDDEAENVGEQAEI